MYGVHQSRLPPSIGVGRQPDVACSRHWCTYAKAGHIIPGGMSLSGWSALASCMALGSHASPCISLVGLGPVMSSQSFDGMHQVVHAAKQPCDAILDVQGCEPDFEVHEPAGVPCSSIHDSVQSPQCSGDSQHRAGMSMGSFLCKDMATPSFSFFLFNSSGWNGLQLKWLAWLAQGSALASTMAGLRKEFEARLMELEDACKDNGTLLRQALSRPATPPAPRSLQELSDQARPTVSQIAAPALPLHKGTFAYGYLMVPSDLDSVHAAFMSRCKVC